MSKIPENAKLVFKGVIFDVYQWEQELYDGSKATFEKLRRPDTVIVFPVTDEGKIILTEQEQPNREPFITGAAGRVEKGEEPLECAKRELLEETGYEAQEWVLLDQVRPVNKIDWTVFIYVAKSCKRVSEMNLDPGEKVKLKLVEFEEFLDLVFDEKFYDKEMIIKILKAKADPKEMDNLKKIFLS
jgi:ADP-ribose pyrophosphatase